VLLLRPVGSMEGARDVEAGVVDPVGGTPKFLLVADVWSCIVDGGVDGDACGGELGMDWDCWQAFW
jgi:hypothetical protein